jgi:hypothetical protein
MRFIFVAKKQARTATKSSKMHDFIRKNRRERLKRGDKKKAGDFGFLMRMKFWLFKN